MGLPEESLQSAPRGLESEGAGLPIDLDSEAIRQTLGGNRAAFEAVVSRHEISVYTLAFRLTGHEEDARDVAQETFLRAYRSLATFDAKRPFRPWLLRITAHAATDLLRRRGRATLLSIDDDPDLAHSLPDPRGGVPGDGYLTQQRRFLLRRAVERLRRDDARLFQLHYGEELSIEQIAKSTGKRPNTIAAALHRLRERLCLLVHRQLDKETQS